MEEQKRCWMFDDSEEGGRHSLVKHIGEAVVSWLETRPTVSPGSLGSEVVYDKNGRPVGWFDESGNILKIEVVDSKELSKK